MAHICLEDLREELLSLIGRLNNGCGAGDCCIQHPGGMHTNASCRCHPRSIEKRIRRLADELAAYPIGSVAWARRR